MIPELVEEISKCIEQAVEERTSALRKEIVLLRADLEKVAREPRVELRPVFNVPNAPAPIIKQDVINRIDQTPVTVMPAPVTVMPAPLEKSLAHQKEKKTTFKIRRDQAGNMSEIEKTESFE